MSRKGRAAAPTISGAAQILGPLRAPFATQGRSYKDSVRSMFAGCRDLFVSLNDCWADLDQRTAHSKHYSLKTSDTQCIRTWAGTPVVVPQP